MTGFLAFIAIPLAAFAAVAVYNRFLTVSYGEQERADEIHLVKTEDGWTIRLYRFRPDSGHGEPVLLCHGAFANHHSFTIPAGAAMVDTLRDSGYDCWLVDLRGSRSCVPPFTRTRREVRWEDYAAKDLPAAIEHICRETGSARVHWAGHSMGGMLLYAYEMLHGAGRIASGVTLGSPPGFADAHLERGARMLRLAGVLPDIVGWLFRAASPFGPSLRLFTEAYPTNWSNVSPSVRPGRLSNVIEDAPPQVATTLAEAIETKRLLVKKKDNVSIDFVAGLGTLQTPLLTFFGARDPFVPLDAARAFFDALPSDDKQIRVLSCADGCKADYGHIDMLLGRHGKGEVFDPIVEWFKAHPADGPYTPPPRATRTTSAKSKVPQSTESAAEDAGQAARRKAATRKPAHAKKKTS